MIVKFYLGSRNYFLDVRGSDEYFNRAAHIIDKTLIRGKNVPEHWIKLYHYSKSILEFKVVGDEDETSLFNRFKDYKLASSFTEGSIYILSDKLMKFLNDPLEKQYPVLTLSADYKIGMNTMLILTIKIKKSYNFH